MGKAEFSLDNKIETEGGEAPEYIHLFPLGHMKARDGRRFVLDDPAIVIDVFKHRKIDIPIDYEHQSEKADRKDGPAPAAGWIKALELREDGLWAKVEWTKRAANMIAAKEYRFISPAFEFSSKTRSVTRLRSAGLTHTPALDLVSLASENERDDEPLYMIDRLKEILGADESATASELLNVVSERVSFDPDEFVTKDRFVATLREKEQLEAEKVEDRIGYALANGYICPAQRDASVELCTENPALFEKLVMAGPPPWGHMFEPSQLDGKIAEIKSAVASQDATADQIAIAKQLNIAPERLRDE